MAGVRGGGGGYLRARRQSRSLEPDPDDLPQVAARQSYFYTSAVAV